MFANELQIVDGKVTGVAVEPIVDAQRKADLLRELAPKEGLRLEQTIAVGDGANDLPMLAWPAWAWPSAPSRWSSNRPSRRSPPWGWTAFSTCWVFATATGRSKHLRRLGYKRPPVQVNAIS